MSRPLIALAVLGCLLQLAGCALLSKAEPLDVRYFEVVQASRVRPAQAAGGIRLRLGAVNAGNHLDRRIVSRPGPHELRYHQRLRWTELPEEYVRRALQRDLFERAGFTRVLLGPAPTLEVELVAFEEVEFGGPRRARVALRMLLHDERVQLAQETIEVEELPDASRDSAEALAAALGEALGVASARVVERVRQVLATPRELPPPEPPAEGGEH